MMEQRITSRKNALLQQVKRLLSSKKEREASGLFVSDGTKLLQEAVRWYDGLDTVILSDGVEAEVPEDVRVIRVPEDVSVMGFDGLQFGEYLSPRLSTVRQNAQQLASRSIEILLEQIDSPKEPCYETIDVVIELRESIQPV